LLALKFGKYVFTCVFEDCAVLPPYKGSTLRGIFGHALKKVVCALKKQDCSECLLANRCLYPTIFEIPAKPCPSSGPQRIVHPPHPYVIEPPVDQKTHYNIGDKLDFTLLLFGEANENLPYFIYAFDQMGHIGIGQHVDKKRASFYLQQVSVDQQIIYAKSDGKIRKNQALSELFIETPNVPQEANAAITIELVTPLRLKYQNSFKAELPFHVLTRAMLRRASSLLEYHGGGEPRLDYRGLVARAQDFAVKESHISWYDWRRYSNRQEQAMMMGGMIGQITYTGPLAEYLALLRFCEQTHIGKQTTFGLGKIRVMQNY